MTYTPFNVWPAPVTGGGAGASAFATEAESVFPISSVIINGTAEAVIGMAGWGAAQSGYIWDDDEVLKYVDVTAETIVEVVPQPKIGDVAIIGGVLDAGTFSFTSYSKAVLFGAGPSLDPDGASAITGLGTETQTVDDLGFDVATDIEAAVETATTEPYDVVDPYDDNLSGFLLWLAIREQQGTAALNGQGVISARLASTIGAQGTQIDFNGAGETYTINEAEAGAWHNVYVDNPCDIVLADTPDDSVDLWPDGTKLYFWHGNAEQVNFVNGGTPAIIRTPEGQDPALVAQFGVVTAVYREPTQEWMLYGDLYAPPTPQVWGFAEANVDFDADGVLTGGYVHYIVSTAGGDVDARLPDSGATVGLPIRVQKFSGDGNDVLITDEAGTSTYYTLTAAGTVEVVWTGSTYVYLPY